MQVKVSTYIFLLLHLFSDYRLRHTHFATQSTIYTYTLRKAVCRRHARLYLWKNWHKTQFLFISINSNFYSPLTHKLISILHQNNVNQQVNKVVFDTDQSISIYLSLPEDLTSPVPESITCMVGPWERVWWVLGNVNASVTLSGDRQRKVSLSRLLM